MNNFSVRNLLPADKTPAERARLKAYSHIAAIVVFNGILASISLLSSGKAVSLNEVAIAAGSQMVLAGVDVLRKFYSASNDLPMNALINLVANEAATRAPQLSANASAGVQAANSLFSANDAAAMPSIPVNASADIVANVATALAPANLQAPAVVHPSLDGVSMQSTLPNIAAIKRS